MSFLDIMFCGFGAVVLLVLILNTDTVDARKEVHTDLRAEVVRLQKEVIIGEDNLVELKNDLKEAEEETITAEGASEQVIRTLKDIRVELARMEEESLASKDHINKLKSDLKNLDQENKRLGAQAKADQDRGSNVRKFVGEGDRQYLTGLKVGGKRVLILVDASASMLDETLVNVIRRRNMSEAQRRQSAKWQRAIRTVEWLVANLPVDSRYQLYAFNTEADSLAKGKSSQWLDANDVATLNAAIAELNQRVPDDGTSLHKAFTPARLLDPKPDNIILITDGLPTQGASKPRGRTVSAEERMRHFESAIKQLPNRVPVNTILFPMEGDATAPVAFWQLALKSKGSFITPARDWP
ncbi:MAG: VWA domain-containing protein [Gammaproteobacteria bacterium]